MVKKILTGICFAGLAFTVFATDARIETMGGTDRFFSDEMSIHRNPANMGLFGNIMYGSYGRVPEDVKSATSNHRSNWQPTSPFFGGAVSFGQNEGNPQRFTIGATFNRVDSALNFVAFNIDELGLRTADMVGGERVLLFAGNNFWNGLRQDPIIDLVGKVDVMLAKTLPNGTTIGLGSYFAFQNGSMYHLLRDVPQTTNTARLNQEGLKNRFVRGNIGVNTPIGDGISLEASVGVSALTLVGGWAENPSQGMENFHRVADNDIGVHIDVRMFSDIPAINGAFVPSLRADIVNYGDDERITNFSAGLGININIDRGFFWTGFYGLFESKSHAMLIPGSQETLGGILTGVQPTFGSKDLMGGRIGFGIERNVLTDWFVLRVGGSKILAKESFGNGGSRWIDTHDTDHVSLGMGVNVENRLKIDFTVSQNLPYTFTGLFSNGNNNYLASRVSAIFAF